MVGLGLVTQGLSSLYGIGQGISQLRAAKKINPDYYAINDTRLDSMASPFAKQMMGRAQMQANARMAGAAQRDRQIQTGLAGTQASIARGAVDPTMAMQGLLASQAQAGQQMDNAAMMDAQFQQQREANLVNAQQTMIGERDKAFNAMNQKYQMDMDRKMALQNAAGKSFSNSLSGLASGFFTAGMLPGSGSANASGTGGINQIFQNKGFQSSVLNNARNNLNNWQRPTLNS